MSGVHEPPDEELVLLSKNGDRDAFNRLVERYERSVYNLCYRLLGDFAAAEDAAQEAFLAAYRGLSRFGGGSFRAWLMRIAANQARDELRRRRRRPASSLESALADPTRREPSLRDEAPRRAEQRARERALQAMLERLPFEQRLVVILIDVQGRSYEEAAEVLDEPIGTVKSRLFRARRKLRDEILRQAELFDVERRLKRRE